MSWDSTYDEFEERRNEEPEIPNDFWDKIKYVIQDSLEQVLLKYRLVREKDITEPRMVTLKELCSGLGISRQTLNKWSKDQQISKLIEPFKKPLDSSFVYDLEGMRKALLMEGARRGLRYNELEKIRKKSNRF